jgi:hypothetical protein
MRQLFYLLMEVGEQWKAPNEKKVRRYLTVRDYFKKSPPETFAIATNPERQAKDYILLLDFRV